MMNIRRYYSLTDFFFFHFKLMLKNIQVFKKKILPFLRLQDFWGRKPPQRLLSKISAANPLILFL